MSLLMATIPTVLWSIIMNLTELPSDGPCFFSLLGDDRSRY